MRTIGVSLGDPFGIGPEIVAKALADPLIRGRGAFVLYGSAAAFERAARAAGIPPYWSVADSGRAGSVTSRRGEGLVKGGVGGGRSEGLHAGDVLLIEVGDADAAEVERHAGAPGPSVLGGRVSFESVEAAIAAAKASATHEGPRCDAIVTAPISKTSWELAGHREFPGHTELLADRFGAARHAMLFVGPLLRVILVTIHVPLRRVPELLTTAGVLDAIELGDAACKLLGVAAPRIIVCGLNPHAGEGGILGEEDDRVIRPAVLTAASRGIDVRGPAPADAVFLDAVKGEFDLVVAMYHDQGLIPAKLVDREGTVNVTVGLPHPFRPGEWLIRTSPAHGTAFDIAGRNLASERSMRAALEAALVVSP